VCGCPDLCAGVVVGRTALRSHRRSEHVWFYGDVGLVGVHVSSGRRMHDANVSTAEPAAAQYTLSRLIDLLNDTQVTVLHQLHSPLIL